MEYRWNTGRGRRNGLEAGNQQKAEHAKAQAEAKRGLAEGAGESKVDAFQRHSEGGGHRTWSWITRTIKGREVGGGPGS